MTTITSIVSSTIATGRSLHQHKDYKTHHHSLTLYRVNFVMIKTDMTPAKSPTQAAASGEDVLVRKNLPHHPTDQLGAPGPSLLVEVDVGPHGNVHSRSGQQFHLLVLMRHIFVHFKCHFNCLQELNKVTKLHNMLLAIKNKGAWKLKEAEN